MLMYMVSLRLVQMAEHPEIMVFSFLFFFEGEEIKEHNDIVPINSIIQTKKIIYLSEIWLC